VFTLVVIVHVLVSLVIIGLVLLQAGKGADIGSAFGGAGSQAVFGSMSTPTLLGKLTAGVAIVFMVTSFWLAMQGGQRQGTIMPAQAPAPAPAPAAPAPGTPAPGAPAPAPAAPAGPPAPPTR
jgi:preprotein translocase subunit SecG